MRFVFSVETIDETQQAKELKTQTCVDLFDSFKAYRLKKNAP